MNRRSFLSLFAASPAARPAGGTIARIAVSSLPGRFHKFVAMNAYDKAPKGHTYTNTLVRIVTSEGVEGIGVMGYRAADPAFYDALRKMIGADPLNIYRMEAGRIVAHAEPYAGVLNRHRHLDGPLFDLIGKLTGKPAWNLIGNAARDRVEVYDGSLYFSDVWFPQRGVRAVIEEAEEALKKGYRGMKLKAGRGWKWMDRETGLLRDIEVIRAVRKAVGPGVKVLADANNGYQNDPERAWRLLAETADSSLYWIEEIFPEDVQQYTRLRERMTKAGLKVLIADGENVREPSEFTPYLKPARLMDVLQMDIREGGFLGSLSVARMAEASGAFSVPHNWGSQVGGLMGLHLSKAVRSVAAAEDDRSTCDVIVPEGYQFRDGAYMLPDTPGLSIRVDEAAYRLHCKSSEVVVQ